MFKNCQYLLEIILNIHVQPNTNTHIEATNIFMKLEKSSTVEQKKMNVLMMFTVHHGKLSASYRITVTPRRKVFSITNTFQAFSRKAAHTHCLVRLETEFFFL